MIETLSVGDLSRLCAEETARYQRGEAYAERYCLELFRRAVVHRDDVAWAAIHAQYAGAVSRWVGPDPEPAESVAETFERFWKAMDSAKFTRFGSLGAVLQYLKMCAHTGRLDRARAAQARAHERSLDDSALDLPGNLDVEESTAARVDALDFWRVVQEVVHEDQEQKVIYLSYVIGLNPRQICQRHPAEFPEVADVYRLKRNALDRLRRSPKLKSFL